jgi:DNA repair photolyase
VEQTLTPSYEEVYQRLFSLTPPDSIILGKSSTDIIRPARGFVDGFDLTMQTQVGCPGGCLFCYVPSGAMLTPADMRGEDGEHWGFEVRAKQQVLKKFSAHVERGTIADKTVYWSGVTDPYTSKSSETRAIWQMLCDTPVHLRPRRLVVQTRYRPDRDVEWMAKYESSTEPSDGGPAVVVSYSIGTDRNDFIRAWERATPLFEQRLKAIERLREAEIWVVPTLSPCGFWDDLARMLHQFRAWGIPYITCLFFKRNTFAATTPSRFLAYVEQEYPQLLNPLWQREQIHMMRAVYGEKGVLLGKSGFASLPAPHRRMMS